MVRRHREVTLGSQFSDVLRLLRRDFYARAQGLSLTPALTRLLLAIAREPHARQIDLAGRFDISPVTLGRMVDRLVEHGYVERQIDAHDARAFRLQVTQTARPLVVQLETIATATRDRALHGFSRAERDALTDLLSRLRANLEQGG
jgi:MarR family transcriptional regulator, transcriptional regulator for hemolysin